MVRRRNPSPFPARKGRGFRRILALLVLGLSVACLTLDHRSLVPADVEHGLPASEPDLDVGARPRELILSLSASDATRIGNRLLRRFVPGARGLVEMRGSTIRARISLPLRKLAYANLDAALQVTDERASLSSVRLGMLPLPWPRLWLDAMRRLWADVDSALDSSERLILSMAIRSDRLRLITRLPDDPLGPNPSLLVRLGADAAAVDTYRQQLIQELQGRHSDAGMELAPLLAALFRFADRRGTERTPTAEHRALLAALYQYLRYTAAPADGDPAFARSDVRPLPLVLQGRDDWAAHFVLSAFLSASFDAPLARALGLAKELHDLKHGSGYSFADLAADWAGVRFGLLATDHEAALRLRRTLSAQHTPGLLPRLDDLPEGLTPTEFKKRYRYPGSEAHRRLQAKISARIEALPWLQRPDASPAE